MDIAGWDQRYRTRSREAEDLETRPTKLVADTALSLPPGTALDLACGAGRNALWLAEQGWQVTAVDGSEAAIALLRRRAKERSVEVNALVADLQCHELKIEEEKWDLIIISYYLQRDLIKPAADGVRPGGCMVIIVHTTEGNEEPTESRLRPGELERYFLGWEILHRYEGKPDDPVHRRSVAEIVARKPCSA